MDYFEAVRSQPANLESSAAAVKDQLLSSDLTPWRKGSLAAIGMGASTHAGHALVDALRRQGRRALSVDASTAMLLTGELDLADSYVFVSEGGRSTETVAVASRAPRGARLAMTNVPGSPLCEHADVVVALGHGADSKVYTVGYTATLQAFGMLATSVEGDDTLAEWAPLPSLAAQVLSASGTAASQAARRMVELWSVDFVGSGASFAAAAEGALLVRESTRVATAAFDTYQYLHGPMEALNVNRGCAIFGSRREVELARYTAAHGFQTLLVTTADVEPSDHLLVVRLPDASPMSRAVLEILPVQLLAGEIAKLKGLAIDGFIHHQDDTKLPVGTGDGPS
jgi:fructoselysine-6-P-deglycase FrlB-like protein